MNVEQIRELAEILRVNDLCALEYVEGDARVRLERAAQAAALPPARPTAEQVPISQPAPIAGEESPKNHPADSS